MKTTIRWNFNRIATVVTTVGVMGFSAVSAQAKPPSHAPAWGYGKDKKDKNDKSNRGRGNDRDRDDRDRDDQDNDRDDRDRDGRDRGGNNSTDGRRITSEGIVVSVDSTTLLRVRATNGRTYIVDTNSDLRNINRGDRVRVSGDLRNDRVTNARVVLVGNANGNNNGEYAEGRTVSFNARISALDARRDLMTVRADNGRTYTVYYRESEDFRVGQNVRVEGVVRNGRIAATSLRRI